MLPAVETSVGVGLLVGLKQLEDVALGFGKTQLIVKNNQQVNQ